MVVVPDAMVELGDELAQVREPVRVASVHLELGEERLLVPVLPGIAWPRAVAVLKDIGDWRQLVEVRKFESVASRDIKTPDERRRILKKAFELTRGEPEVVASLAAEQASIMRDLGEPEAAARYLEHAIEQAMGRKNPIRVGRLQEQLARTYLELGLYDDAQELLRESQKLIPLDYLMAHCLAANTAVALFARRGDFDEARDAAEAVLRIAEPHGYAQQLHVLQETLDRFRIM